MSAAAFALAGALACFGPQSSGPDPAAHVFEGIADPSRHDAAEAALRRDLEAGTLAPEQRAFALDLWARLRPDRALAEALLAGEAARGGAGASSAAALRIEAQRLRRRGELERARDVRREAAALEPANAPAALIAALAAREDGRIYEAEDGALAAFEALSRLRPRCPVALYFLVDTLRSAGRAEEALARLGAFADQGGEPGPIALDDRLWAGGLAAEIESRDLRRPRAARGRCVDLVRATEGAPAGSVLHAEGLRRWYSRSVDEAVAYADSRRRLQRLAAGAALAWLALAALAHAALRVRAAQRFSE